MPESGIRENTFREALFSGSMDMEGMDAVLDLYRELYPGRTSPKEAAKMRTPEPGEVTMRLEGGFTILDPADLLPDPDTLADRSKKVSLVLARHSEDPASVAQAVDQALSDPSAFLDMARAILIPSGESPGAAGDAYPGPEREIMDFIIFNAAKDLFLNAAVQFSHVDTEKWDRGSCPVCGGGPAVGYLLGEGGKRHLICHRCEAHWRFRRLSCPYCGKENPGDSRYVYLEEPRYKGMRGQVCDGCKSFIKTWRVEDEDLGGFHPEVEDLKTPAFDAVLEGEGFSRGAPNIFGVRLGRGIRQGH
ncbi:MAG: formate dehydrogenase accessory protein FdhE [Proteobacteria bacterium]|nr:formate dehydrogenase accessory protein FdhE [Pseudomonadota bacterium]